MMVHRVFVAVRRSSQRNISKRLLIFVARTFGRCRTSFLGASPNRFWACPIAPTFKVCIPFCRLRVRAMTHIDPRTLNSLDGIPR